jgi:hypothetical protein
VQVSHPRQAGERFPPGAEFRPEPGDFGQSPGHQGGSRVEPEIHRVGKTGGDSDDVFQGARDFHADDVPARVDSQAVIGNPVLDAAGQIVVGGSQHQGGGMALGHLPGETRARENADPGLSAGEGRPGQNFAHAAKRTFLDPFSQTHDIRFGPEMWRDPGERLPEIRGRHGDEHCLRPRQRVLEVGRKRDRFGKAMPGKKDRIFPSSDGSFLNFRFPDPKPNGQPDSPEMKGERGTPASAADNAGGFHKEAAFWPNLVSVPRKRRTMFDA